MRHRELIKKKKGLVCSYTGLEVRVKLPQRNWLTPRGALLLHWAAMNTSGHPPLFLPKSFLHTRRPVQEINGVPPPPSPVPRPQTTHLPAPHKYNISRSDVWCELAADEQRSTGKSGDGKSQNRKGCVCFQQLTGRIHSVRCQEPRSSLETGRKGGNRTLPSCSQQWSIRV